MCTSSGVCCVCHCWYSCKYYCWWSSLWISSTHIGYLWRCTPRKSDKFIHRRVIVCVHSLVTTELYLLLFLSVLLWFSSKSVAGFSIIDSKESSKLVPPSVSPPLYPMPIYGEASNHRYCLILVGVFFHGFW